MDSLYEDIFNSYDREPEPEPEPEPFEETLDSSCTQVERQCAKCQKLGRRCFRCRLKLALRKQAEEPTKSALELAVASQAAQANDESEDTIPEPAPIPSKTNNETTRLQHTARNGENPSAIPSSSPQSQLNDYPQTPLQYRTGSLHTSSHETYFYDGVTTRSARHYERNNSSHGAATHSRTHDIHPRPACHLHNHDCSEWMGRAPGPPSYYRSNAEIEVVRINRSWHLVSTKCHVEKHENGGITHNHEHRHWAEPCRELPHCKSYRALEEKKANIPGYFKFGDATITFIERVPWRRHSHAV
jgi:hypothetical protein